MQWMTVTSLVPCHALHVPQHVAVSVMSQVSLTATVTCNQYYMLHAITCLAAINVAK